MTQSLSRFKPVDRLRSSDRNTQTIFFCPEESMFYSQCLDRMVLDNCENATAIIEFGSGEGSPVINSLLKHRFDGLINGYELNPQACEIAQARIEYYDLSHKYVIHNASFFHQERPSDRTWLIANPPYLPAIDNDLYMPALYGGTDGSSITKELLAMEYPSAMLMISAYSDPIGTIEYAVAQGYQVDDFIASPMSFGYYSSEPKVRRRIAEMHQQHKAFYSQNIYVLAGVFFAKRHNRKSDLSMELIKVLTAL
jgi:methylase of polypeptide subunit release factors